MVFRMMCLLLLILIAACGGDQPAATNNSSSSGSGETFTVDISGDMTITLSPEGATAQFAEEALDESLNSYVLWFGTEEETAVSLIFYDTEPPQPGTYTISTGFTEGTVSGLVVGRNSEDDLLTFAPQSGTVTLDSAGETYSGSFEFTAQGGVMGSGDQEVSVTGTFSSIQ